MRRSFHHCFRCSSFIGFFFLLFSTAAIGQSANHTLLCSAAGPDSVYFDKTTFNRYLPGEFDVSVAVWNDGTVHADSLYAFPRSNPRFTVVSPSSVLLTDRLLPGDTARATFTVRVNPRTISGLDTIVIAISGKEGARTDCPIVIWVEKEYRPVNLLICPPAGSVSAVFVDTLNDYRPNPLAFPLTIRNEGDAPSKETRLFYVATPGLTLADGQPQSLDLGVLTPGASLAQVFRLNVLRRAVDTTVLVRFRVQGKGGLGDRIIDTLCSYELFIPAARDVLFALDCENQSELRFENGAYTPNPFTWTVKVRNTGSAKAKNVRATLSHPVAVVVLSPQSEILVGDLNPGQEISVTWLLRALPVFRSDTSQICVDVFDTFNRRTSCCDTLILPAVRAPLFEADCTIIPDSIHVNPNTGLYQPTEFFVDVLLTNIGTDPADSVYAEIIIADPDIQFIAPVTSRVLITPSFAANAQESVRWTLAPVPVQVERDIEITVRITSRNAATVSTICKVYIAAALKPEFECSAETLPADTLHYSIAILEYDPLVFRATIRNNGTIAARNLEAAILLPSGIGLPLQESTLIRRSDPLGIDSVWTVSWSLQPLARREGTLDTIRVEFRSGNMKTYCEDWIFIIGIPPVTVFTIPRDALERFSKEVRVPVLIDEARDKEIRELQLHIQYDPALLRLEALEYDSTLLARNWTSTYTDVNGRLIFNAQTLRDALSGSGELFRMRFTVLFGDDADILRYAVSPLEFDSLASSVNRGSVLARFYDGYVTVSGDCLWPLAANENYVILTSMPNPFNPSTTLTYELRRAGHVTLLLFDETGRYLQTLVNERQDAGTYQRVFLASGLASGSYRAVLLLDGQPATWRNLQLLR
ncbi:MAG: cohesin domain-containing protein [Bacteroidia bacterium]|nr:cohesin domain-containing protein [Bacteroidia bacterium]